MEYIANKEDLETVMGSLRALLATPMSHIFTSPSRPSALITAFTCEQSRQENLQRNNELLRELKGSGMVSYLLIGYWLIPIALCVIVDETNLMC